ncbi:unnamed protein product [Callosobruchus maculatus]|uniref:Uncharacterized protein n=1 Tax=Callosobruchus maculatus TaxID=64391 RepID=A0A653C511_CALMS|nr:unnamed protein product [Callosobruchus maculatus]
MTDYTLQIIMDSFYDMPRCAPAPTPVDKFFAAPAVPEVSLFCPGNGQTNYNAWRVHHHTQNGHYAASSQVNISKNLDMRGVESSVILKKQVRFEGPISHHHPIASSSLSTILKEKSGKENKKPNGFVEQKPLPSANTFEQIYMANIPSRQLDLSIVDLPRNDSKKVQSNSLPHEGVKCRQVCVEDKHRENLSICEDKCESVTDDFNKNDRLPKTYQEFLEKQKKVLENASLCDNKCESQKDIRKNDKLPKTYQEFSEKQRKGLENKKILGDNCVTDLYNYKRSPIKVPSPIHEKNYNSRCPSFTHAGRTKPFGNPSPDNNQQLLNESHAVRNIQNTQASNFDFNHRVCESEHQIPSQHKCTYGMPNMCNEDAKGCIAGTAKNVEESQQISPALSNEPTTTDLLKIIAQQNEQLLLLQKQVAVLLSRENTTQNRPQVMGEKIMSSTQTEHFHQQMYTPKKRGLSKFSIDMMTSFEVAIRPSQHNKNQFPKIQEITETESASEPIEPSLRLEEPVNIPENCPSPEPTVNIEMQDYDSSEDKSIIF